MTKAEPVAHSLRGGALGASAPASRPTRWSLSPRQRKAVLAAHIVVSVGLLGIYAAMLLLGAVAATTPNAETASAAYRSLGILRGVIPPAAVGVLITGIGLALATSWGLFKHYWVVVKLAITIFSTVVLLMYTRTFRQMADLAADSTVALDRVRNPSPVLHAALAMLLLLTATVLAVYKPVGVTAYGRRKQLEEGRRSTPTSMPQQSAATAEASPWLYVSVAVLVAVILVVVILHLTGTVGRGH